MNQILRGGVLCVVLWLAACSDAPAPSPKMPSPAAPVVLTVWHTQTGAAQTQLDALVADFQKAYPPITLRVEAKANAGELLRQGVAASALNQTPDLVITDSRAIAEFARKGALVNLDPWLDDATLGLPGDERADFFGGVLDASRIPELKNQQFALPFDKRVVVLFYNADLLRAAKADVPPQTWDQFGNAVRATTRGNTRGWAMTPNAGVLAALLASRGGSVLNDAQKEARLDDEATLKMLQLITALTKSGATYLVEDAASARAEFAQSRAAFWFGASDQAPLIADALAHVGANFQWGVANVPQNDPSRPVTVISGADVAIFRSTPERHRAAWTFARWLTLPEQGARWARATPAIPLRASSLNLLAANPPALAHYLRAGLSDTPPAVRALPVVGNAAQIDNALVEMWISVANGADPGVAQRNAAARINRLLGQIP